MRTGVRNASNHTVWASEAVENRSMVVSFLDFHLDFLGSVQNAGHFLVEFLFEFRVVSEVSVCYVQHVNLARSPLEVGSNVLAVDRFHYDDNIRPIDKFL